MRKNLRSSKSGGDARVGSGAVGVGSVGRKLCLETANGKATKQEKIGEEGQRETCMGRNRRSRTFVRNRGMRDGFAERMR